VPCLAKDGASAHWKTEDGESCDLSLESGEPELPAVMTDTMILNREDIELPLPAGVSMREGFLAFEAVLPAGVDRVTVRLSIPSSVRSPRVIKLLQDRVIQDGDPEIGKVSYDPVQGYASFLLIDNGPLDLDSRIGVLFDPVAVADTGKIRTNSVSASTGGGGGGGGCSLKGGASEMDLLLIFLPLLVIGLHRIRRKSNSN